MNNAYELECATCSEGLEEMSDDVFGKSPWDEPAPEAGAEKTVPDPAAQTVAAKPAAEPAAPPEGVTLSFKGGSGYDASLLVLRAADIAAMDGMLESQAADLASLMRRMARIQAYNNDLNASGKRTQGQQGRAAFSGGRVVQAEENPDHKGEISCPHGRTYIAKNGWEGYFCNSDGMDKCRPSFRNRKTGVFELAKN